MVGKDHPPVGVVVFLKQLLHPCPVKDVVAKDECYLIFAHKISANDKGLRQPVGDLLHRIAEAAAKVLTVAQQALEA